MAPPRHFPKEVSPSRKAGNRSSEQAPTLLEQGQPPLSQGSGTERILAQRTEVSVCIRSPLCRARHAMCLVGPQNFRVQDRPTYQTSEPQTPAALPPSLCNAHGKRVWHRQLEQSEFSTQHPNLPWFSSSVKWNRKSSCSSSLSDLRQDVTYKGVNRTDVSICSALPSS